MNNNVILSSKGKGNKKTAITIGFILLAFGALLMIVFALASANEAVLYEMLNYDRDLVSVFQIILIILPVIILVIGVISIFSAFMYKNVYIDVYSDYVKGEFVNSKGAVESVTLFIKDIVSVTNASGAVKINTAADSYQIITDNNTKKQIIDHLNAAMLEYKRNNN